MKKQTMIEIQGGGATRKTAPDSDLTISHSEDKDNLSPKIEEFYEKMIRHSGLDPESINADKNRLRLGGRNDESGKIIPSSFRHPELDSGSIKIGKDSGSEAGMTGTKPNILQSKKWRAKSSSKAAFTLAEVLITLGGHDITDVNSQPPQTGSFNQNQTHL